MNFVRIQDYSRRETHPEKEKILKYLKSGEEYGAAAMSMKDVFTGKYTGIEYIFFADDKYAWSTELIYHVEKYDCKLPEDFLSHIESRIC